MMMRFLVVALVSLLFAPGDVKGDSERLWTPSDEYVAFGAMLMELAVASRHMDRGSNMFKFQGSLGFEQELAVEKVKIKFSKTLRKSFELHYPGLQSLEDDEMLLPYYVSPDVASVLANEGYKVPLVTQKQNEIVKNVSGFESGRRMLETSAKADGRVLFQFPIICDLATEECQTQFLCWGISQAIDGMNMEQTCNIIEKIGGITGGQWTINDWLRELPEFMDNLKDLDSIAGVFSMKSCGFAANQFSLYSHYGEDALFYYPKAMCEKESDMRGCVWEIALILQVALSNPIGGFLPTDVTDVLKEIKGLTVGIYADLPRVCVQLHRLGLLGTGNVITFLSKWESLFDVVPSKVSGDKIKLEVLLNTLSTLSSWDFVKDYIPSVPRGCSQTLSQAGKDIYNSIFAPGANGDIVQTICGALSPTVVTDCMNGLVRNIDGTQWIANTIGNGNLHNLTEQVVPSLCQAMTDLDGFTVKDVFTELPLLLRVYKSLSLNMLSGVLPGVHDNLMECGEEYAVLVEDIEEAFDSPKQMIKIVCGSQVSENQCLTKLSDGLDQMSFATDIIGTGTLKIIIQDTIPGACEITRKIIDVESNADTFEIVMSTILRQLPNIIAWYESLTKIEVFEPYMPKWPGDEACPDIVIQEMSSDLAYGFQHMEQLPHYICKIINPGPQRCLLAFGENFEESDLVRDMFSSSLSANGPNATFHELLDVLLPSLCLGVKESSFDAANLIGAVPQLLASYKAMDIIPMRGIMPEIHELLTDGICPRMYSQLAEWIKEIANAQDDVTISKICARFGYNPCIEDLGDAIDKLSFISDQIGKGSIQLLTNTLIPNVCVSITETSKSFDIDNLVESLPSLLLLVDNLIGPASGGGAKSSYPLAKYIPNIPRDAKCRTAFQGMAKDIVDFMKTDKYTFTTFMDQMCQYWPTHGYIDCLVQLGDSFDKISLIRDQLGGTGTIQGVASTLLPATCKLLSPSATLVDWDNQGLIESLPVIIDWYKSLQPQVPGFVSEYLPVFPAENCSSEVIQMFKANLLYATETPGIDVNRILKVTCSMLSDQERTCLTSIGRAVDSTPVIVNAIGLKEGGLERMLGVDLDRACTLIGDEFDSMHWGNIVLKIPELLRFMTSLRESVPQFLLGYMPVIPHEQCDDKYTSISVKLADGLTSGMGQIPGVICSLNKDETECISLLGDSFDEVEFIEEMIGQKGLLRYAMETILNEACTAFGHLVDFEIVKLAEQIPAAMKILQKLNSFAILDPLIPDIPTSCDGQVETISLDLAKVIQPSSNLLEDVPQYLCKVDDGGQECLADLGKSLEEVEWISDMVPGTHSIALDLLKLLPLVCALLFNIEGDAAKNFADPDVILEYLPTVLSLFDTLRDVSFVKDLIPPVTNSCMAGFRDLGDELARYGLNGAPEVLCGMRKNTTDCFIQVGDDMNAMSLYAGLIPEGMIRDLVSTLPTACKIVHDLGDFSYDNILVAAPTFLDLLEQLNSFDSIKRHIPDISKECELVYRQTLIPRFAKGPVVNAACAIGSSEEICIKDLVRDTMDIPMIASIASGQLADNKDLTVIPALVDSVFQLKPGACDVYESIMVNAGTITIADNVFTLMPSILALMEDLRSFKILNSYVPAIQSTCKQQFVDMVGPTSPLGQVKNELLFPHAVCDTMLDNQVLASCVVDLATEIDGLAFMPDDMHIKDLASMTVATLPETCGVIEQVIDRRTAEIDFDKVYGVIPTVARIYSSIQQSLPSSLQTMLPAWPDNTCNTAVMTVIAGAFEDALNPDDSSVDIPSLLCSRLQSREKQCLADLGDTLDQVAMVRDMLGRPGLVREMVGEPLGAVCTLLGTPPESGAISIFNLLSHFDTVLHIVEVAHNLAPDFAKDYLPTVPADCDAQFTHMSLVLGNFSISSLCRLDHLDIECLAQLGDRIEETPALRDLIYAGEEKNEKSILRTLAYALSNSVCKAFDELGSIQVDNVLAQIPELFGLLDQLHQYPVLQSYIPAMPAVCLSTINPLVERLRSEPITTVACSLQDSDIQCAKEFAHGITATEWSTSFIPDAPAMVEASLDVLPGVCGIIDGDFEVNDVLKYLPKLVDLYEQLDKVALAVSLYDLDIGDDCRKRLKDMSVRIETSGGVDMLPETMCLSRYDDWECVKGVGLNVEKLPVVSDMLPKGLIANVVDLFRDKICSLLFGAGDLDYAGFVSSIPLLMDLIAQLEEMDIMTEYIPDITDECKFKFKTSITEKVLAGIKQTEEQGLLSISHNLDFGSLTTTLCNYTVDEIECFKATTKAIVEVPVLNDLIQGGIPQGFKLDTMVDAAFAVRDDACDLFRYMGRLDFNNIMLIVQEVISIMDRLNSFPVIEAYVPDIGAKCVGAVENITSYATGDNQVQGICGMNSDEKQCLIHIGRELDKMAEVRFMFDLVAGTKEYPTIEATIEKLVTDVLGQACNLFSQLALDMEGSNIAMMIGKIPDFLLAMHTLAELPFINLYAPALDPACENEFENMRKDFSRIETERDGVILVCGSSRQVRGCIQELNDAFEQVDFIAESIPDGLVKAFLDSLDAGCKIAIPGSDVDRSEFLAKDLPILVKNVGIIANVNNECVQDVEANVKDDLCKVNDKCLYDYLYAVTGLPLIGTLVPEWTTDVIVGLCAVKSGDETIEDFLEKNLGIVLQEVSEKISEPCKSKASELSNTFKTKSPKDVCVALDGCIDPVVNAFGDIAFADELLPPGLNELLKASCAYLNGVEKNIFALLPHMVTLFEVLGMVLGYPSDTCSVELVSVTDELAKLNKFDGEIFCHGLDDTCTTEVVLSMRRLPFIGGYLPNGSDDLIAACCAVIKDKRNFQALVDHVSTLFEIMGKLVVDSHMDLDRSCQEEITEKMFGRSGTFHAEHLCLIESGCSTQIKHGLQKMPVVGEFVPDSLIELLQDMCTISDLVEGDGKIKYTDAVDDPNGLAQTLPNIFVIFGKILSGDNANSFKSRRLSLEDQVECGRKIEEYGNSTDALRIGEFCAHVPSKCMTLVSEKLETIPILNSFIPERAGELLATSCDVLTSGSSREMVLERLPSFLAISASITELPAECKTSIDEVAALFKSKGGVIDGKTLCSKMPDESCLSKVANGLQNIPYLGDSIPDDIPKLLIGTCDLIDSKISFSSWVDQEGVVLLQLAGFMSGVDGACEKEFAAMSAFSTGELCKDQTCLVQLGDGLKTVPLVGSYIPAGLGKDFFEGLCDFVDNPEQWQEFAKNTLPKLLYIVGRAVTDSNKCAYQLESFGEESAKTSQVSLDGLCRIEADCMNELMDGLENLPLYGPFVPKETKSLVSRVCTIHQEYQGNRLSEMAKIGELLTGYLHVLAEFVINLVNFKTDKCKTEFVSMRDSTERAFKETGHSDPAQAICIDLSDKCVSEFISSYRSLSLIGQLVPKDTDVLINFACPYVKDGLVQGTFKSGGMLDHLVTVLPVLNSYTTGSAKCDANIKAAGESNLAGQPDSWKTIIPCIVGNECMTRMMDALFNMPLVKGFIANPAAIKSILTDQTCPSDFGGDGSGDNDTTGDGTPDGNTTGSNGNTDTPSDSTGLSTGAIAGIALAVLSAATVVAVLGRNHYQKKKNKKMNGQQEILSTESSRAIIPHMRGGLYDVDPDNDDEDEEGDSDEDIVGHDQLAPIQLR